MRIGKWKAMAACAVMSLTGGALGAEVTVQNDTLMDFQTAAICICFVAGEEAAVWLTAPCDGALVAVQVLWLANGAVPPSLENAIYVYDGEAPFTFPVPGPPLPNSGFPINAVFEGPVLTEGVLNEYRFLDEQNSIPLNVPMVTGQRFVVSLEFLNDNAGDPGAPSVVSDANGCQLGKNTVFANGLGWVDACLLGVSGDWVILAVIDCGAGDPGACCLPDGSCLFQNESACDGDGGIFQGENVECNEVVCEPQGACCEDSGGGGAICFQDTEANCIAGGGVYQGDLSACPPTGSCVFGGACCFEPKGCLPLAEDDCGVAGGTFLGVGVSCTDCDPIGACCLTDGECAEDMSPEDCAAIGGAYQGNNVVCLAVQCTGGCCLSTGGCLELLAVECAVIPNSSWAGPGTDCTDGNMSGTADACEASCAGDTDGDGDVDVDDLNAVILDWGTDGSANNGDITDASGTGPPDGMVNVNDLNAIFVNWGDCP